jgi:hypothetical protein
MTILMIIFLPLTFATGYFVSTLSALKMMPKLTMIIRE